MTKTANAFMAELEKLHLGFTKTERDTDSDVVKVMFKGKNCDNIHLYFFFDHDERCLAIRIFGLCKYEGDLVTEAIIECNRVNSEFRWLRLYVDSQNEVDAAMDTMISVEDAGDTCMRLMMSIVKIIDDVYPRFANISRSK